MRMYGCTTQPFQFYSEKYIFQYLTLSSRKCVCAYTSQHRQHRQYQYIYNNYTSTISSWEFTQFTLFLFSLRLFFCVVASSVVAVIIIIIFIRYTNLPWKWHNCVVRHVMLRIVNGRKCLNALQ